MSFLFYLTWKRDAPVGEKEKKVWSCQWVPQFSTFLQKGHSTVLLLEIYVLNPLKYVTQTPLTKYPYQICFFFLNPQFSVFKHWKLLFEHCDQTSFRLSIYVLNYVALI